MRNPARTGGRLHLECLEDRLALSGDGLEGFAIGNAPYLTLSFAPDGTDVGGRSSQLFADMNGLGETSAWQDAISSAFQMWAIHTNADVAVVSDSGEDFGIPGRMHNDARFGDIRVGAIPLRHNVFAIGVSRGYTAGTWSGDILFNSRAPLDSLDEVFRVAMHEAGHVFGLEDSMDEKMVMFRVGIPSMAAPSAEEITELQSRFGERAPDQNELEDGVHQPNDTEQTATRIRFEDSHSGQAILPGSTPSIIHADIGVDDVDVYRFSSLEGYAGAVTFEVRTSGLSQLRGRLVVRDENGVDHGVDDDPSDGLFVQLPTTQMDLKYYVSVEPLAADPQAVGGYSLITTFDERLLTPPEVIDEFAGPSYRFLNQDEIQEVFAGDPEGEILPLFGDDLHLNDTFQAATTLEPSPGFAEGVRYETLASLSDETDIDFYEIVSPAVGQSVMSIMVEGIDDDPLQADVQVLNEDGQVVAQHYLVRHGGRTVVQVSDVTNDQAYFVRIASEGTAGVGNYLMTAISGTSAEQLPPLFSDTLDQQEIAYSHSALRPQLISLAYDGQGNDASGNVQVSIEDADGNMVFSFGGQADQFVSTDSVLLEAGAYRIIVRPSTIASTPIGFRMLAAIVTDPLAVPRVDTVNVPFTTTTLGQDDDFVFPNPGGGERGGGAASLVPPTRSPAMFESALTSHHPRRTTAASVDKIMGELWGGSWEQNRGDG